MKRYKQKPESLVHSFVCILVGGIYSVHIIQKPRFKVYEVFRSLYNCSFWIKERKQLAQSKCTLRKQKSSLRSWLLTALMSRGPLRSTQMEASCSGQTGGRGPRSRGQLWTAPWDRSSSAQTSAGPMGWPSTSRGGESIGVTLKLIRLRWESFLLRLSPS